MVGTLLPTPSAGNFNDGEDPEQWEERRQRIKATGVNGNGMGMPLGIAVQLLPTPRRADADATMGAPGADAIARWEHVLERPAPPPTIPGRTGNPKLNPEFALWMMGVPAGWVTDVPDVTDNEALRLAGNGVCPQQAAAALTTCLNRFIDGKLT